MRTLIIFALYACAYGFGRSFVLVCNQFADMVLHKIFFCSIILLSVIVCPAVAPTHDSVTESHSPTEAEECVDIYNSMHLEGVVNFKAFRIAYAGYNKIINRNKDILTLIDFSKPSTEKRLFVFDMKKKQLMFSSLVSHGRNSGDNYATSFSNEYGSYKSSLGFYLTETTYNGKNGYPKWTGKGNKRSCQREGHCGTWRFLCQPFGYKLRRKAWPQSWLSGLATESRKAYNRCY